MNQFVKSASLALFLTAASVVTAANATPLVMPHIDTDCDDGCVTDPIPAVSEADTLPLMAVGLGLIGLRLRRKNK
ncbi:MAG: PEP-CTERM sorting domain-containing protein [Sulfuriferula sp.]